MIPLWLGLACAPAPQPASPPPTPPQTQADCETWRADPETWGYCLTMVAGNASQSADELCGQAGRWESTCREAWVGAHTPTHGLSALLAACGGAEDCAFQVLDRFPNTDLGRQLIACRDHAGSLASDCVHHALNNSDPSSSTLPELLSACGDAADCAFRVLDALPSDDVTLQLDRCAEHAGSYTGSCVGHAVDRWLKSKPNADSFAALAVRPEHPDKIGRALATAVACQGVGSCDLAAADTKATCLHAVHEEIAHQPAICDPYR